MALALVSSEPTTGREAAAALRETETGPARPVSAAAAFH